MDKISPQRRSENMRRIRGKNTKPELTVRRIVWRLGIRYRLHARHLPGTPDLVFAKTKQAIFVHGCFWHQHPGCKNAVMPKSNRAFWRKKLRGNQRRDAVRMTELLHAGWRILVVWECQAEASPTRLEHRLRSFLLHPPRNVKN